MWEHLVFHDTIWVLGCPATIIFYYYTLSLAGTLGKFEFALRYCSVRGAKHEIYFNSALQAPIAKTNTHGLP